MVEIWGDTFLACERSSTEGARLRLEIATKTCSKFTKGESASSIFQIFEVDGEKGEATRRYNLDDCWLSIKLVVGPKRPQLEEG